MNVFLMMNKEIPNFLLLLLYCDYIPNVNFITVSKELIRMIGHRPL